jgi:hypothetical protein
MDLEERRYAPQRQEHLLGLRVAVERIGHGGHAVIL